MPADKDLPVVFIACRVMEHMLKNLLPANQAEQLTFMDYGLHRVPDQMTVALQRVIDSIGEPSLVVLGYGLCGMGLQGIRSGVHMLLIPRADDCIAILLGSREAYMREFAATPGTYYLSKGWLESGSNPLDEYEEYAEKYGPQDADRIMDLMYHNYKRLALVAHSQEELEQYRPKAQAVAEYCARWGMRYEEILGSDRFIRRLVDVAAHPEQADDEFVVIPPGGEILSEQFIRNLAVKRFA